jgi:hypothetical protein
MKLPLFCLVYTSCAVCLSFTRISAKWCSLSSRKLDRRWFLSSQKQRRCGHDLLQDHTAFCHCGRNLVHLALMYFS